MAALAEAEGQIKPFIGATFAGGTTFIDPEHAVGKPNPAVGATVMLLGEVLGVEVDLAYAPGFFQTGQHNPLLVLSSSVTTLSGDVVIALPRRLAQYSLRP